MWVRMGERVSVVSVGVRERVRGEKYTYSYICVFRILLALPNTGPWIHTLSWPRTWLSLGGVSGLLPM
jgi:hypothetical protein